MLMTNNKLNAITKIKLLITYILKLNINTNNNYQLLSTINSLTYLLCYLIFLCLKYRS